MLKGNVQALASETLLPRVHKDSVALEDGMKTWIGMQGHRLRDKPVQMHRVDSEKPFRKYKAGTQDIRVKDQAQAES